MPNKSLIFQLREEKNVSQDFIATLIGVSRPKYSLIEDEKSELTISQARKLCDYYQISFEDFLSGKKVPVSKIDLKTNSQNKKREVLRIDVPSERVEVFKEVLLYILNKVGGKPSVGQTVLYKLLYFIDFDFYELYERQLIGAKYIHNHYGPTPIEFSKIVEDMKNKEELEELKSDHFQYPQTKYLALREPNLSLIGDAVAIKHIDMEIHRLSNKSAKELTRLSHQDIPWITAQPGDVLDYEAVFYRTADTSVRAYDNSNL